MCDSSRRLSVSPVHRYSLNWLCEGHDWKLSSSRGGNQRFRARRHQQWTTAAVWASQEATALKRAALCWRGAARLVMSLRVCGTSRSLFHADWWFSMRPHPFFLSPTQDNGRPSFISQSGSCMILSVRLFASFLLFDWPNVISVVVATTERVCELGWTSCSPASVPQQLISHIWTVFVSSDWTNVSCSSWRKPFSGYLLIKADFTAWDSGSDIQRRNNHTGIFDSILMLLHIV